MTYAIDRLRAYFYLILRYRETSLHYFLYWSMGGEMMTFVGWKKIFLQSFVFLSIAHQSSQFILLHYIFYLYKLEAPSHHHIKSGRNFVCPQSQAVTWLVSTTCSNSLDITWNIFVVSFNSLRHCQVVLQALASNSSCTRHWSRIIILSWQMYENAKFDFNVHENWSPGMAW